MNDKKLSPSSPPRAVYEDEINLLDYWNILVRHKKLIAVIVFITTLAAAVVSLLMAPIYRAEVLMAPVTDEETKGLSTLANQFNGLAALAGINVGGGKNAVDEAIATLKSRALTEAFIKEENLMPVLFPEHWDAQKKIWKVKDPKDIPGAWDAYKKFNHIRKVQYERKTGLVMLSIEWTDPELAARWANRLVERLNRHQQQDAIQEAEKSIAFLKQELVKTNVVEMQQTIYRLIEAQMKSITLANARNEYAFRVIDPAVEPQERAKPKRTTMVVGGFLAGLVIAVFLAFFINFLERLKHERKY